MVHDLQSMSLGFDCKTFQRPPLIEKIARGVPGVIELKEFLDEKSSATKSLDYACRVAEFVSSECPVR
jgi:hypothetical protein